MPGQSEASVNSLRSIGIVPFSSIVVLASRSCGLEHFPTDVGGLFQNIHVEPSQPLRTGRFCRTATLEVNALAENLYISKLDAICAHLCGIFVEIRFLSSMAVR